jgi:FdrA protein
VIRSVVRRDYYQDSVSLMLLSTRLRTLPGVTQAGVMMGTPLNKERFEDAGLLTPDIAAARPSDLCVVVEAETEGAVGASLEAIEEFFRAPQRAVSGPAGEGRPRTIESALRRLPQADLALISVPGEYAGMEAERALRQGLHVFLFSDNVPVEEEVRLKTLAAERGLLCMGPDCGTAIVAGVPLGFANQIPRGPIGLVGASGTGLQEVTCLIARRGAGISHALGTGGRDVSRAVGGRTFVAALRALGRDPETKVLVLVSKPPDPTVAATILDEVRGIGKPVVVAFIGNGHDAGGDGNVVCVESLLEAAEVAVSLSRDEAWKLRRPQDVDVVHGPWIQQVRNRLAPRQRWVRGLYCGGTLADEAALILGRRIAGVSGPSAMPGVVPVEDPNRSAGHAVIDLGDDVFTRGRPHPMIDPGLRAERVQREAEDPAVAVLLLDVVLGYGAHPDPAGALVSTLRTALARRPDLAAVASVVGTDDDQPGYKEQRATLEDAGVRVVDSNAEAALLAAAIVAGR